MASPQKRPHFKLGRDRIVHEGKFIRTIHRDFIGTQGKPEVWEMIQRKIHGRIVGVVALTKKNELVMNKIYRVPLKSYILEFPAGLSDKKGESEISLARRELLEETGYAAKKFELLMRGPYNSGLTADELSLYLARNAKKVREPEPENAEDIEVVLIPLARFYHALTRPQKGLKVDIKNFGVLELLRKKGYNG